MENNKKEKITKELIKARGWSDSMISKLLPKPDTTFDSRGRVKYHLWLLEDVEAAETTESYKELKEKYDKRKTVADKIVQDKTEKFLEEVDLAIKKIKVRRISIEELTRDTISAKEDWYCDFIDRNDLDPATLRRWQLNYIRHNLTDYDKKLYEFSGKIGINEGYIRYKNAVMAEIAKVYPELCEKKEIINDTE